MSWWKHKRSTNIAFGASTHVGRVRSENQDAYGCFPEHASNGHGDRLFIVADGMGGHAGGKEASRIAIDEVPGAFFDARGKSAHDRLRAAFITANERIYTKAHSEEGFERMGTTCTALAVIEGQICIAHVGDTRAYRITNDTIEQLTNDHTLVEEMRREGVITADEARVHPRRNTLTRALGVEPSLEVDVYDVGGLNANDRFLLCSDGLAAVTSEELMQIVLAGDPQQATEKLVAMANERGGHDNVTVVIIHVK
ncbi:MAG: Stp1/IreP family PP2C-type Ser/Thr phosphatase [Rhodothermales bacterium]